MKPSYVLRLWGVTLRFYGTLERSAGLRARRLFRADLWATRTEKLGFNLDFLGLRFQEVGFLNPRHLDP